MLTDLVITLVVSAAIGQAPQAPSRSQHDLTRLVDLGEHISPRALADARRLHERLCNQPDFDARAQYAFALVLIQQHRSCESIDLLHDVLKARPDLLPAWRTMLWGSLAARKYPDATTAIAHVAELAAASDARERDESAFFLGTVFGYLEGPRSGAVPAEELRTVRQKTLGQLGTARKAFAAGEEAFTAQFADLTQKLYAAQRADAETQSQRLEALKIRQDSIDRAETDNEFKVETLKTDLKAELDSLERQVRIVQTEIMRNQYRVKQIEVALTAQQSQMPLGGGGAAGGKSSGSNKGGAAQPSPQQVANLARIAAMQLVALGQLSANQTTLGQLVERREELLGETQQTSSNLRSQRIRLGQEEKEVRSSRKRESRRSDPLGRESRALQDRLHAFATYVPFPFERERQLVLEWPERESGSKPKRAAPAD